MKRSHLIAILVAAFLLLALSIAMPAFMLFQWHQAGEFAQEQMEPRVRVPDPVVERGAAPPITIHVDTAGDLMIEDQVMSKEMTAEKLRAVASLDLNHPVLIRSDKNASWESVTEVIAILNESGLWNISFATQNSMSE